jgi:hypothetical protein
MKHCISAARAIEQVGLPAAPSPRDFHITILRRGQPEQVLTQRHGATLDAYQAAVKIAGDGAVVRVRPLIEQSYFEGLDAYPRPLHAHAAQEARRGWDEAPHHERHGDLVVHLEGAL